MSEFGESLEWSIVDKTSKARLKNTRKTETIRKKRYAFKQVLNALYLMTVEQMVKKLLDEYVKTQRDMIIEERRLEKDEKKAQQERIKIMEDSQKHFFKDQIDMLKEEYVEAKREEEIVVKAQAEVIPLFMFFDFEIHTRKRNSVKLLGNKRKLRKRKSHSSRKRWQ